MKLCWFKDVWWNRRKGGFWVFLGFHGFINFCIGTKNIGEIEGSMVFFCFCSIHGFMKFCWLKDVWWNRREVGFGVFEVFMVL